MHAHSLKKDESSLVHLVLGWNGRKNMEMGVEINSKVHWQPSTSLMSNIDCIYKRLRKKDGRSRPKGANSVRCQFAGTFVGGNHGVHGSGADTVLLQRADACNRSSAGAAYLRLKLSGVLTGG